MMHGDVTPGFLIISILIFRYSGDYALYVLPTMEMRYISYWVIMNNSYANI